MAIPKNQNPDDLDEVEYFVIGGEKFVAWQGSDAAPLMNKVIDKTEGWGKVTSRGRTASASYLAFIEKHKQARIEEEKKRRER